MGCLADSPFVVIVYLFFYLASIWQVVSTFFPPIAWQFKYVPLIKANILWLRNIGKPACISQWINTSYILEFGYFWWREMHFFLFFSSLSMEGPLSCWGSCITLSCMPGITWKTLGQTEWSQVVSFSYAVISDVSRMLIYKVHRWLIGQ